MLQRQSSRPRRGLSTAVVGAAATFATAAAGWAVVLPATMATAEVATANAAVSKDAKVNYWRGVNPVTELTADTFAEPPANDKPWVRWNWPPATTTIAQLETDLEEMAATGIAGVEIGQGGNPTNEQLQAILTKANALDITVGIKYIGGAPVTWDNTDDRTRRTINNTRSFVDAGATFNGPLPGTGTIVAAVAYRCTAAPCPTTGVREVDRTTAVNLTSQITGKNTDGFNDGSTTGSLNWTAPASPAGAQWVIVTFRAVAFQNAPETLTRAGTDAMIAGYEALWTPEIKALLQENRSDIFVDSHANDPWGNALELWSSSMAGDFQSRAGYSIVPDLAALFYTDFKYSDGRDERVRTDFYQVRNDLFIENRIKPFTEWANTRGMTLRLQPEDPTISAPDVPYQDQIDMAYNLQRPEHEGLVGDQVDVWRPIASANSWTGNPWYSTECCAVRSLNYVQTLQDIEVRMNKHYAAGVTKNVYHVYPTDDSPTSTYPGYANFGPTSFSGAWGPRNPNWAADGLKVNTWMARNQQVLTQGRSDIDVGVYLHSFEWPAGNATGLNTDGSPMPGRMWNDLAMQRAGYSWDYINPKILDTPEATVTAGVLNAAGPSYKAFIINTGLQTPWHPRKHAMPVATAKRILELTEDGMKVLVVGDPPSTTPGDKGNDAALRAVIADLLAQPGVHRVASEAGVPVKLAELGIQPDAKPAQRSTVISRHLRDPGTGTDYYYLYNQGLDRSPQAIAGSVYEEPEACRDTAAVSRCQAPGSKVDVDITLKGSGTPYLLDTTSGSITPLAEYKTGDGTVTVPVALGRDEATIIALSNTPRRFGVDAPSVHVESTTADLAAYVDGELVIRDTESGTYSVTLSNGRTVTATIEDVPAPLDLTGATWELDAEDWKPANPMGSTGAAGSAIAKEPVSLTLNGLKPWPDIPELAQASGVGTYTTQVTMPSSWSGQSSAVLSLGQVVDTVALSVNGKNVPIDDLSVTADIGRYLKAGENTVTVRVSTTLNNRLAALLPAVASRGIIQEYGLVGPVTLKPYGQAIVPRATGGTPTPTPTTTPTPTPPAPAVDKVEARIATKVVKPLEVGTKVRLRVTVRAYQVVPTGTVKMRVKGAGKQKAYTRTLNVRGRTKVWLPTFQRTGKVTVRVTYLGDAAVKAKRKTIALRVVDRRTVR